MNMIEKHGKSIAVALCAASFAPAAFSILAAEDQPGWNGDKYVNPDRSLAKGWQEIDGENYYFEDNGEVDAQTTLQGTTAAVAPNAPIVLKAAITESAAEAISEIPAEEETQTITVSDEEAAPAPAVEAAAPAAEEVKPAEEEKQAEPLEVVVDETAGDAEETPEFNVPAVDPVETPGYVLDETPEESDTPKNPADEIDQVVNITPAPEEVQVPAEEAPAPEEIQTPEAPAEEIQQPEAPAEEAPADEIQKPVVETPAPEVEVSVEESPAPEVVEDPVVNEIPVETPEEVEIPEEETPAPAPEVVPEPEPVPAPEATPEPEPEAPAENKSLDAAIAEAAKQLVGVTDGMQCTEVVQLALANAGVSDAYNLWPDEYAGMYGYYTSNPQPGNLIYYNNGGRGKDHIAIYLGNGMAVHGNFWVDGQSYTVVSSVYTSNGGQPQFIQVVR